MFHRFRNCGCTLLRSCFSKSRNGKLHQSTLQDSSFQCSLRAVSSFYLPTWQIQKPLKLSGLLPSLIRTQLCKCSTVAGHLETDSIENTDDDKCTVVNDQKNGESAQMQAARLDLEMMRNAGRLVPEKISDADLEYYSSMSSKNSRKRFAVFLARKEQTRLREKEKRRKLREERELEFPTQEPDLSEPMLNRILVRLQPNNMLQFENWRLAAGMKFGPKIAYDFSYDEHMKRPEIISLVKQMMHSIGANKLAKDPFDIHWVGLKDDSMSMREMRRMFGSEHFQNLMVTTTEREVQDVFPVEDIVYLTSDSPNILRAYDPNKVYVLGGLVDSHKVLKGVSFAKVKRLNLNHARLPLDLFLKWGTGGKNLTLDQMIQILIELNTSGDWTKALSYVPTRKHEGLKSEQPKYFTKTTHQNADSKMPKDRSHQPSAKYSFSRAKHSRNWPTLDEPPFQRSKKVIKNPSRQRENQVAPNAEEKN
ncbi:tRNA methyltransferase 10 homolog C-like [Asterias rubens]|uniref:tRNA methyltransferase 10 homolog C-like n=1 Tax=Asterias rubens TaxID=7604 RepID=UPI00145508B8|nr:tRNA methyltransferase 10 homolog C-like [Asterias rubens]